MVRGGKPYRHRLVLKYSAASTSPFRLDGSRGTTYTSASLEAFRPRRQGCLYVLIQVSIFANQIRVR